MNDASCPESLRGGGASAYSRPRDASRPHSLLGPPFRRFTLSQPRARAPDDAPSSSLSLSLLSRFPPCSLLRRPPGRRCCHRRRHPTHLPSAAVRPAPRYARFNLIFVIPIYFVGNERSEDGRERPVDRRARDRGHRRAAVFFLVELVHTGENLVAPTSW